MRFKLRHYSGPTRVPQVCPMVLRFPASSTIWFYVKAAGGRAIVKGGRISSPA
jgi:hypothetical protein